MTKLAKTSLVHIQGMFHTRSTVNKSWQHGVR